MFFNFKNRIDGKPCKYPGAVLTRSYELVTACVNGNREDGFTIDTVFRTAVENAGEFFSMFNTPVYWAADVGRGPEEVLSDHEAGTVEEETMGGFKVSLSGREIEKAKELLCSNLAGIYPADIYLLSLPLAVSAPDMREFVSVSISENLCKVAVIKDRKTVCVYRFVAVSGEHIRGYIGRIERNWKLRHPEVSFPGSMFICGYFPESLSPETEDLRFERVFGDIHDFDLLCCAGVSSAAQLGIAPLRVTDDGVKRWHLKARGILQIAPVLLFLLVIAAIAAVNSVNFIYEISTGKIQKENAEIMSVSNDIMENAEACREISSKIIKRDRIFRKTGWGPFLSYIQENIPEGVFLEQLVSKSECDSCDSVIISLTGWSGKKYSAITEFVSVLDKNRNVSNVKLADIDQDRKKRSNLYEYRILCTLKLKS